MENGAALTLPLPTFQTPHNKIFRGVTPLPEIFVDYDDFLYLRFPLLTPFLKVLCCQHRIPNSFLSSENLSPYLDVKFSHWWSFAKFLLPVYLIMYRQYEKKFYLDLSNDVLTILIRVFFEVWFFIIVWQISQFVLLQMTKIKGTEFW